MPVNQLKAGVVLNYVSIVLNMVIGLIYTPFMLRKLGQSEYGLYSLAASIIAYLTVLDLGFGNAIVRYTAKFRAEGRQHEQEEMFGMFLLLYSGIGLIAVCVGALLTLNIKNIFGANMTVAEIDKTRIMLWLMTFNLAITFPMSIWGSIMTAYERFVFQRVVSIVRGVLNPIVMITLLIVGYKAIAMVIVTTAFNVVTLFVNYWYCKHRLHISVRFGRFNWGFLKEVSIYSSWIFLNAIMDRIYWSTGQFVLGIYRGTVAIAVYAVAIQLQSMYHLFSTAVSSVFLPKVTAMVTRGEDNCAISDLFVRTGRIQYIVMAYILTAFIVFGRPFIQIWAGMGYEDSYVIALLFFVPLTVPLIQNIGITILQARNQMRFRCISYIIISLASLGLSIPMAKYYGGIGCAVATSIALTLGHVIIMNIYYRRKQSIAIYAFWREILKMSIVPLLLGTISMVSFHMFCIKLTHIPIFLLCVFAFSALYMPLFWRFSMNKSERMLFLQPLRRIIHK